MSDPPLFYMQLLDDHGPSTVLLDLFPQREILSDLSVLLISQDDFFWGGMGRGREGDSEAPRQNCRSSRSMSEWGRLNVDLGTCCRSVRVPDPRELQCRTYLGFIQLHFGR